MAYLLTGVQHTTDGDIIMPVHRYDNNDAWKEKYHREMDYAISNPKFLGLGIKVLGSHFAGCIHRRVVS